MDQAVASYDKRRRHGQPVVISSGRLVQIVLRALIPVHGSLVHLEGYAVRPGGYEVLVGSDAADAAAAEPRADNQ